MEGDMLNGRERVDAMNEQIRGNGKVDGKDMQEQMHKEQLIETNEATGLGRNGQVDEHADESGRSMPSPALSVDSKSGNRSRATFSNTIAAISSRERANSAWNVDSKPIDVGEVTGIHSSMDAKDLEAFRSSVQQDRVQSLATSQRQSLGVNEVCSNQGENESGLSNSNEFSIDPSLVSNLLSIMDINKANTEANAKKSATCFQCNQEFETPAIRHEHQIQMRHSQDIIFRLNFRDESMTAYSHGDFENRDSYPLSQNSNSFVAYRPKPTYSDRLACFQCGLRFETPQLRHEHQKQSRHAHNYYDKILIDPQNLSGDSQDPSAPQNVVDERRVCFECNTKFDTPQLRHLHQETTKHARSFLEYQRKIEKARKPPPIMPMSMNIAFDPVNAGMPLNAFQIPVSDMVAENAMFNNQSIHPNPPHPNANFLSQSIAKNMINAHSLSRPYSNQSMTFVPPGFSNLALNTGHSNFSPSYSTANALFQMNQMNSMRSPAVPPGIVNSTFLAPNQSASDQMTPLSISSGGSGYGGSPDNYSLSSTPNAGSFISPNVNFSMQKLALNRSRQISNLCRPNFPTSTTPLSSAAMLQQETRFGSQNSFVDLQNQRQFHFMNRPTVPSLGNKNAFGVTSLPKDHHFYRPFVSSNSNNPNSVPAFASSFQPSFPLSNQN